MRSSNIPAAPKLSLRQARKHRRYPVLRMVWLLLPCFLCTEVPGLRTDAQSFQRTSTAQADNKKPLTRSGLEKALRTGGLKSAELVSIIQQRGVDFPLDHDTGLELRGAGADANVLEAIRQNYRPAPGSEPTQTYGARTPQPQAPPPQPVTRSPSQEPPPASATLTARDVSIPAGTLLPVQLTETLGSGLTKPDHLFHGVVSQDILIGNLVVLPRGTAVLGRVTEARDAATFAGNSRLTLALLNVLSGPQSTPLGTVNAASVTKEGEGHSRSPAGNTGEQVQFPSGFIVRFSLISPLLVRVSLGPAAVSSRQPAYR